MYLSPALSETLRLLQFPIQPAASTSSSSRQGGRKGRHEPPSHDDTPTEARYRPRHDMLELDYPVPAAARGADRPLTDKMCLSSRTHASTAVTPVTHMALAKMNKDGTRMNLVPLRKSVLQMRPTFEHLRDEEDEDPAAAANDDEDAPRSNAGRNRPILFQRREAERSARSRRNSYAHKRASEESEEWVELDVHGASGTWSEERKEYMAMIKCPDKSNVLRLAKSPGGAADGDGGYVKSLNYLDTLASVRASGEDYVEDLSDWTPSAAGGAISEGAADNDVDMDLDLDAEEVPSSAAPAVGETEGAASQLAAKIVVLLQRGRGAMIPYRALRSRFNPDQVSDEVLTLALSSCAVLVRGNFALKSSLATFLGSAGGASKRAVRELRDLILLLLNMHGGVQRERLVQAYDAKARRSARYDGVDADVITFVLETVARRGDGCWVAKVDDDEVFAAEFPEVAACHGLYWTKRKEGMAELVELYENAEDEDDFC